MKKHLIITLAAAITLGSLEQKIEARRPKKIIQEPDKFVKKYVVEPIKPETY